MLQNKSKSKLTKAQILEWSLLGFVLTMPFKIQINSVFLILTVAAWLISCHALADIKAIYKQRLYKLFVLLYLLYLLGVLYSANMQAALAELELKISLLLLPPIIYGRLSEGASRARYLRAFVAACLLAALASLLLLFYKIYFQGMYRQEGQLLQIDWVYFSYHLPKQIDFHAPFFSMYTVMCMFIVTSWLLDTAATVNTGRWAANAGLFLFFLVFTVFLASRTALIAGIAILVVGSITFFISKRKFARAGIFLGLLVTVNALLYLNTPYLQRKMEESTGVFQRQQIWQAGIAIAWEHPLIGVGPGDTKDQLAIQYKKMGMETEAQRQLDPHNQYIQLVLALGIIGLLTYLACLFTILETSISHKIYLLAGFVLLYGLCGITESVFNTQKGLIFFSLFTSVLAFRKPRAIS